ncbi:MAG: hypothetical protein H7336_11485 [Bacteriovorax sp.]|nr:hypothetical protein [Bacteriovorax sp.]
MKSLIATALLLGSLSAFAAPKTYQVTGPIMDMNDTTITVQKGKEKWEISKDASSKVTGELKVGAKVTIEYVMTAKTIEAKEDKKAAKTKK